MEVDGVIVAFQPVDGGSRPVVRWVSPGGQFHLTSDGLPVVPIEWRGRGDVLRMVVDSADPAFAVALAGGEVFGPDAVAAAWGRRVEATVVAHAPDGTGSTRVQVRYFDRGVKRTGVVGPLLRTDPREPDDPIDLGMAPDADAIQRPPTLIFPAGPTPPAADDRARWWWR
jgi:hypothetical protein